MRKGSRSPMLAAGALAIPTTAAVGSAAVEGPGNGGGQSGQCTGPQDDRPANCNSRGGSRLTDGSNVAAAR